MSQPTSANRPDERPNPPQSADSANRADHAAPASTANAPTDAAPPQAPVTPSAASTAQAAPTPKQIKPRRITLIVMALLFVAGVAIVLSVWHIKPFTTTIEQTDNSYVRGNSTVLSSQINGYVDKVLVKDFDHVRAGQTLLRINADNYNQQVVQAESAVTQAQTNLANQQQVIEQRKADIRVAQTRVAQAQTQLDLAQKQLNRLLQLVDIGAVSQAEVDTARANVANNEAALKQAYANLDATREALKTAEVAKIGLQAQIKSANSQVNQAKTIKNYSEVVAPITGQLGQVGVRNGQYVSTGTQLMYIIPADTWVIANFKETQMQHIHIGQPATFSVDALGGKGFTGHVNSISPATGSEFSVIKTDNATGNFTKVVQRIAVRIDIDPDQPDTDQLRPGMSVVTKIDTAASASPDTALKSSLAHNNNS